MKQLVALENYFFPEISVMANPTWDPHNRPKAPPFANISSECKEVPGKENTYEVQLKILIENTEEHPSQYNVQLMAYGILTAHEDLHDKKNNMYATGSSILYSASREFLLGIMLRGPWPPIMLQAMPFNISRPDSDSKTKTIQSKPKKPTPKDAKN